MRRIQDVRPPGTAQLQHPPRRCRLQEGAGPRDPGGMREAAGVTQQIVVASGASPCS